MTSKESSQGRRKYKLGNSGIIIIDESAKDDFMKLMNWSKEEWKLHTKLLMNTNECQISSSQEDEQILEELSTIEHDRWSDWQRYVFEKCTEEIRSDSGGDFKTGNLIIPKWAVEAWSRQIRTPYSELSEKEKRSDREQVLRYWHIFLKARQSERKKIEAQLKEARECMKEEGVGFCENWHLICKKRKKCKNTICPLNEESKMTTVLRTCTKCGNEFEGGIFPQSTCDMCSEPITYSLNEKKK